ncbi:hypothetical protein ACFOOM_09905 [Streptomyces echinoruber]|nr:hypothetical protein [Streptomyces echinoruber]
MPVFAFTLLLVGLSAGIIGLLGDNGDLFEVGVFIVITAVPLNMIRALQQSQRATADQLANADHNGYFRALDHVARGLLDVPRKPTPGHREHRAEPVAGNVIELRPNHVRSLERKAQ